MFIPLNQEKIKFVREHMHFLDYKNMRDLLKLLLVEKLDKMEVFDFYYFMEFFSNLKQTFGYFFKESF